MYDAFFNHRTIQYLMALHYTRIYSVYVRYSEIILRCAQEILRVKYVFFVALHIVLDHLVLQFNNNEKSQVNMGYRDDILSFMVQNAASIRQSGCYICVAPALH
jgi:hypothetical protein